MRITFVVGRANLSGGSRVVAIYAQNLQRRGHKVTVVARPGRNATIRERLRRVLKGQRLPGGIGRVPSHFDHISAEFRTLDRFRPVTAADLPDADVVVATWWETAEWVHRLPPAKGAKVHFMQDYEDFGGPRDLVDATCRLPMPRICIVEWVARKLRDEFARPAADILVVPNSVDLERFNAPPRGKQPVPCFGLTYTTFHNKGCDISIAALNLARRKAPELKVVAFGAIAVSESLPLPEGATYHHRAPDAMLREIYAQADGWLFGTRIEGFGLPILEAMACRTPVIGTPSGAAPQLLAGGRGILVPPENPMAMAEAIERVCRMSDAEWRAMSDSAYAHVSRYTWEDATDRFEAALLRARRGEPLNADHA